MIQPNYKLQNPLKSTWIVRKEDKMSKASDTKSQMSRTTFRDDGTHSSHGDPIIQFMKMKEYKPKQDHHEIVTVTEHDLEEEEVAPALTAISTPKFRIVKKQVQPKNEDPRLHAIFDRNALGTNKFTDLGGGIIESSRGKA